MDLGGEGISHQPSVKCENATAQYFVAEKYVYHLLCCETA